MARVGGGGDGAWGGQAGCGGGWGREEKEGEGSCRRERAWGGGVLERASVCGRERTELLETWINTDSREETRTRIEIRNESTRNKRTKQTKTPSQLTDRLASFFSPPLLSTNHTHTSPTPSSSALGPAQDDRADEVDAHRRQQPQHQ